ncbi:MAG: glycosyltransferase family 9 protein [Bacteroidetes bacterium]|jgi:ADP-heptose:LPS heptosyltransferase|nr:glycosyltransferase family 9 protein [Bacteroidota bacterium]
MPRILVIRLSSIGDIVLTTPVIRCLKKQIKDTEIHFLTKKSFSDVLASNPYIDNTFYWQDNSPEIIRQLKTNHYDYIVDLHKNMRTWKIKSRLRVKSYSFEKLNIEKWLLVNFKINKLPHKHIVDRYFDAIQPLGVVNDGQGLDFFINPLDEIDISTYLPETFRKGYTALVIGAKHATKQLPLSKLMEVCKKVSHPIVVLGGFEDRKTGMELEKHFPEKVFNACGKTGIGQSASLIRQCNVVITHDTGLMHIAAALRKKIISVWGNTVPEFGMYPYLPKNSTPFSIVEVKNLYCRPCTKIGYNKCPKKHFRCMMEIDTGNIAELESKYYSSNS